MPKQSEYPNNIALHVECLYSVSLELHINQLSVKGHPKTCYIL